jgi:MFS family permease
MITMNETDTTLDSRAAWSRLFISMLIATVGNAGIWIIVLMMPAIQAEFGVDRAAASIPYALTLLAFAFGNYAVGSLVDRIGFALTQAAAAVLIAIGMAAAALSPSYELFVAAQIIIGFGASASFGPLIADISLWFMRRRGTAVGIAACGNYIAGAAWPLALSGVLATDGWRAVYVAMGLITLVTVLPLTLLLRAKLPESAMTAATNAAAAARRRVSMSPLSLQLLLSLAGVACCVAMAMPQVHIVSYCVDLGYGPAVGAEMLALMLAGGAVSRFVSGVVADFLGGIKTVLIGSALQGIALFFYIPFDGLMSLYVVSTIFGLSQGGIVPGYAVIVREFMPPKEAGARVGFVMMATIAGMSLGGWMTGFIYDLTGSYQIAFLNGIAWNWLNIMILGTVLWRSHPPRIDAMAPA